MEYTILISIIIGLIAGFIMFYMFNKFSAKGQRLNQAEIPRFSEKEAEGLLRKAGFQILDKKRKETVITVINGKDHLGYVEVDYVVRKNKRKFPVVVHVGEGEPDPNEPALRRRLLEFARVVSSDGVLVVDANKGQIQQVRFRFPRERNIDFFFRFLIALFVIFGVIGIIWGLATLKLF